MVKVQLSISEGERDRFARQAREEGLTLGAWLRDAASRQFEERQASKALASSGRLAEFFRACDAQEGLEPEPDWEEHLQTISTSRGRSWG